MHPSIYIDKHPNKPAIIAAESGEVISYAQLEAQSNRAAHLFRRYGLQCDDVVAFMVENHIDFYGLLWGAQRAGLRYVCLSTRLTASEADYILDNSAAKLLVISPGCAAVATELSSQTLRFAIGYGDTTGADVAIAGYRDWASECATMPSTPIADERAGIDMLYSSGTTGQPKGIRIPLPEDPALDAPHGLAGLASGLFGMSNDTIYLSPSPLYHAAPLRWSMVVHRLGGTVVLMKKFEAEAALAAIEKYRVTSSQWVPTHFVRMLKLPVEVRSRYDTSSLTAAIHAAAPCPMAVKQAMIDWWGPVLLEYYAGSEGNGLTYITSEDWLSHRGSVGRALLGIVHIMSSDGETELAVREEGLVYFESPHIFEYHRDEEKTADSRNSKGWSTLGDIGWLDEEGFLYLTDRKSFVIISGGVNIYPQEIENHLISHPAIADIAVVSAPHADMGEEVVAVVQLAESYGSADSEGSGEGNAELTEAQADALRTEITAFARTKLSGVKIPRRIDFVDQLPRHDTGKLYKRLLRDQYWQAASDSNKSQGG